MNRCAFARADIDAGAAERMRALAARVVGSGLTEGRPHRLLAAACPAGCRSTRPFHKVLRWWDVESRASVSPGTVETEHLLLAALDDPHSLVGPVLERLGSSQDSIRDAVRERVSR
jgi:hypothetical protein